MYKTTLAALTLFVSLLTLSLPAPASANLYGYVGQLSMLRVHDVGTAYGPDADQIDVEVVIALRSQPGKAFGFQLRNDNNRVARAAMLNLLRDAFENNWSVRIDADLVPGKSNGILRRVWVER